MVDSIHQRIISAIDTRFKTILIAGGYKTNMGQHVFAWKETPFDASEIDGLNYRDRREQRTPGCGVYEFTLPIEIEVFSSSPEGIRKCLADLEKAIFVDETWGGLAENSEIDSSEMAIEHKEHIYGASNVVMTVEYRTVRGDPDTAA